MFDNLTTRERVLAWAVLCLVPISIAFMGVFWFIDKYGENNTEFIALTQAISSEKDKTTLAIKANQRRIYYRSVSLPSNLGDAANDYQIWLKNLVRDEVKMDFKSVTPRDGSQLKYKNKLIGRTKTFTLLANADLQQLTRFLYEFYSVDLLHRINSIKIIPLSSGSASEKKVRSGKLSLIINLEAVSLVDADEEREFTKSYRELARTAEEYQQKIVRRNIFGPANNTPTVSARPSSSYTSESDISVSITGDDADDHDLLIFELLESQIEGVKLVHDEKSRRAKLEIPGQKAGKYEFKIGVRDNGFPSKMNETRLAVTFKDRKKVEPPPPPPPKPEFQHAKETRITGIVKDRADNWVVWIKVRTTGESYALKTGESFELDKQDWKVESIIPGQAIFKVDNRLLTISRTDTFAAPSHEEIVELPAKTEAETSVEEKTDVPTAPTAAGSNEESEDNPSTPIVPEKVS